MREKDSFGRMSVLVRIVFNALQEHEAVICSNHNDSQRDDFICRSDLDGFHLKDKTNPALEPDAKTRRMTESNVKLFQRPLQSASTSARLAGRIRRRPGG